MQLHLQSALVGFLHGGSVDRQSAYNPTSHLSPDQCMNEPLLSIGSYLSPYVRKVLVLLELKEVAYRIDPIVPFFGNEEFERLSPLRQIPVLVDGDLVLNDSS